MGANNNVHLIFLYCALMKMQELTWEHFWNFFGALWKKNIRICKRESETREILLPEPIWIDWTIQFGGNGIFKINFGNTKMLCAADKALGLFVYLKSVLSFMNVWLKWWKWALENMWEGWLKIITWTTKSPCQFRVYWSSICHLLAWFTFLSKSN